MFGSSFDSGLVDIVEKIILGVLIIAFLRAEPAGLSALVARIPWPSSTVHQPSKQQGV
jgi:branched-chain amino acid transport system permease protein